MFEFNYIKVNATSEFACIEDLAFACRAEVISDNILKVDRKLVHTLQFEFILPIYSFELLEISLLAPIKQEDFLFSLAGENLWGEPRVIEHIPAMTDEEFSSILPTIWD